MKNLKSNVMSGFPPTRASQVTYSNYSQAAFNKWGFRNIDAAMHTAMLSRGGELPNLIERPKNSLTTHTFNDAENKAFTLDALLETYNADGFIVLKDGEIAYENYWNGFSAHQRHIWFSMTKSLVSVAFGILMEQFEIDLEASPAVYIDELKNSGFERVTIQDILNHASAIDFKENYIDPESDFIKHYAPALGMAFIPGAQDVQPHDSEIYGIFDFLTHFVKQDNAQSPGTTFEYNSANADVIGWLIARLSGMSLQAFLETHIWSKLGTYHDAAIVVDRAFMAVATGGMTSTLRDAALFGQLILNRGRANGAQLVPEKWLDQICELDDKDRTRYTNNKLYQNELWQCYKNMWWVLDKNAGEYAAVGIHGQVIYINRKQNTVIAQFSSQDNASQVGSLDFKSKLLTIREISTLLD